MVECAECGELVQVTREEVDRHRGQVLWEYDATCGECGHDNSEDATEKDYSDSEERYEEEYPRHRLWSEDE